MKLLNFNKDYKCRFRASKFFLKKQIKRSFLFDKNLSLEERQIIYTNLNSYNSNYSVSRFKNYCFISGHSRSVYSEVKLSRHFFKNLVLNGALPGWIVSSW